MDTKKTELKPDVYEQMARRFHDCYERRAPDFGYSTRDDTKSFDPESPNGLLMRAVCLEVMSPLVVALAHIAAMPERDQDDAHRLRGIARQCIKDSIDP